MAGKSVTKTHVILGWMWVQMAITGCHSENRELFKGVSQKYAQYRSSILSHIRYDLEFDLDDQRPFFSGTVDIHFNLKKNSPLTIDFQDGIIHELVVNDQVISKPDYNHIFLTIESRHFKKGKNRVSIVFDHDYSKVGKGLYRFWDPEDKRIYLYSDFEPYDANLMFPCFDQPDLKATYTLMVKAPLDWTVVSSTLENRIEKKGSQKIWYFPQSEKFSTYIFSLHAGPYRMWKSTAGRIALRLFVRRSFSKYIKPKEWFLITQQGFFFYEKYFGIPYPFKKYDQLVVPDFNSGAMENVAAVTFSERYMPRGEWTDPQRENLAETILHEMAHMWFGNLVTMRWWDDLWLNESFASYMSTLALSKATEFKRAWQTFYGDMKQWAYWEDQLVTTHPIVASVENTHQAFVNFDGITYGKGASVLKQLAYFLGEVAFRDGIRKYFKKYAYQNTQMKDFIDALAEASHVDLTEWTRRWLTTSSLNIISVRYDCNNEGRIQSFSLDQSAEESFLDTRAHKTQIGFFDLKKEGVVLRKSYLLGYQDKIHVMAEATKEKCPTMIYPNYQDYDYVKVKIDPTTLIAAQSHLSKIKDPFSRMMMWQSLWDMVRDAELSVQTYADLVFKHLPLEGDIKTAQSITSHFQNLVYYFPRSIRLSIISKMESLFWDLLQKAKPKSDFQKLWIDTYVSISETTEALQHLISILNGKIKWKGLNMDQDRRWRIIVQLSVNHVKEAPELVTQEFKKDPSENGQKFKLAAEAAWPSLDTKKEWFQKITSEKTDVSLARLRAVMEKLFPRQQDLLREHFSEDFFRGLLFLTDKKEPEFFRPYIQQLVPAFGTKDSIGKLQTFISQHPHLPPTIMKHLRIAHQEDGRTFKIRNLASEDL